MSKSGKFLPSFLSAPFHSSVDGHPGWSSTLGIMGIAVITMDMQMFLWSINLGSFGHLSRSGVAGLFGSSVASVLRNLHTDFRGGCTCLQLCRHCVDKCSFSPTPWTVHAASILVDFVC